VVVPLDASKVDDQHQHAPTTLEMPRIPNALLRKAHAIDPLLPALLAPCRDLHAAQSELRWLREHVEKVARARARRGDRLAKGAMLRRLIQDRASGKPLQYILGTEFFGNLEVRCRPGVLIPRCVPSSQRALDEQLLRPRTGKTPQPPSRTSSRYYATHINCHLISACLTSAPAPAASPSSSSTSCTQHAMTCRYTPSALTLPTKL
jgi:hypothetical protein